MIEQNSVDKILEHVIFNIIGNGRPVKPRGMACSEVQGVSVRLMDVRNNVLLSPERNLNYRFMVAEWLWMSLGMQTVEPLARYNKHMLDFSDDGLILRGAYGPRILDQLKFVTDSINRDADTRQAVMTIWERNPVPSKDVPCTIAAQFIKRRGCLNSIWTMRSSDTWLGLPYDMFCFSQITNWVASMVNASPGWMQITLGSSHLYDKDFIMAQDYANGSHHYAMSPVLYGPVPEMIRLCLLKKDCGDAELVEEPWLRYGQVLVSHGSKEALDCLTR